MTPAHLAGRPPAWSGTRRSESRDAIVCRFGFWREKCICPETLDECETDLWLLTHPESRHLGRIGAVYSHLAQAMRLP